MSFRLIAFLGALMAAGCVSTHANLEHVSKRVDTDYTKTSDVVFTPTAWPHALKADLYQPKGDGPWPAVLLVYGGSWSSADHRWQMVRLADRLARRGFVVMNASYRGTPEFHYPAPMDDLQEALRWLREHADDFHANPNKVATYGFSAGGHLASLVGTLGGPPNVRVQAIIDASGPTDLTLRPTGDILPRFLGTSFEEQPELYRKASPVTYVTAETPPVFIYQGTDDTTVSPNHSRIFKAALDRAGVRNELHWVPGRGHATVLLFSSPAEDSAIDFLDDVLR